MNKIYKLVWSKVKNCYVVASELTKRHSKGGSKIRGCILGVLVTAGLVAAMVGAGAFTNIALAADEVDPTNAAVKIGKDDNGKYYMYQTNQPDVKYYIAGAAGDGVMTESYEGVQTVTAGCPNAGSTEYVIMNVATGNKNPVGTMAIKAGENITISAETVADTTANGEPITRQIAVFSATDTTLAASTNALTLDGNKIIMSVQDTNENLVTGTVDLSDIIGGKTYTLSGEKGATAADGSTTYTVKLNDGTDGTAEIVDTNTTYTMTKTAGTGKVVN